MDLSVPYTFMFYATQFAQDVKFGKSYVEYHFSMENMLKKKQQSMLKPIQSDFFADFNKEGEKKFF